MEERLLAFIFFIIVQHSSGENFQLCDSTTKIQQDCSAQIRSPYDTVDVVTCDVEFISPDSIDCIQGMRSSPVVSSPRLGQISIKPFVLHLECPEYTFDHAIPNILFKNRKWKSGAEDGSQILAMRIKTRKQIASYVGYQLRNDADSYDAAQFYGKKVTEELDRKVLCAVPESYYYYKGEKLKFRIEKTGVNPIKRHCRNLEISDEEALEKQTVLKYDCYKPLTNGSFQNGPIHVLDVEATDGAVVDRRQFLFYIPSVQMLMPITNESDWKPFIYVENLVNSMQLRIMSRASELNITYQIEVKKSCNGCPNDDTVDVAIVDSSVNEVTYDYTPDTEGSYYFVVSPILGNSGVVKHQFVKSPQVFLGVKPSMLFTALIITGSVIIILLIVYIIYRHFCRIPTEIPQPPKVLVIYPSSNSVHAECVASFVDYLRSEYGFDISYDGDVRITTHEDPYFWAEDAIREASHIMYIVGPKESEAETKIRITAYPSSGLHNVDKLLLSFLKAVRALKPKNVINVFFEHSVNGSVPNETRNDRAFYLLADWQKLIAYLSKDLLPKKQIMRTERGKYFMEKLRRVKLSLNESSAVQLV